MQDMYTRWIHLHITEPYKTRRVSAPKDYWIKNGWIVGLHLLVGGVALVVAVAEKSQLPTAWPFFWK